MARGEHSKTLVADDRNWEETRLEAGLVEPVSCASPGDRR